MTTQILLERLASIPWSVENIDVAKSEELAGVRTYLDIVADMLRSGLVKGGPLFSPLNAISRPELLQGDIQRPLDLVLSRSKNVYESRICRNAVEWAILQEASHPFVASQPALFEPLLRLIEKRVPLRFDKGYLSVGDNAFPIQLWPDGYGTRAS